MTKREIEKLLHDAVAQALGVEATTGRKPLRQAAKPRRSQPAQDRAAA